MFSLLAYDALTVAHSSRKSLISHRLRRTERTRELKFARIFIRGAKCATCQRSTSTRGLIRRPPMPKAQGGLGPKPMGRMDRVVTEFLRVRIGIAGQLEFRPMRGSRSKNLAGAPAANRMPSHAHKKFSRLIISAKSKVSVQKIKRRKTRAKFVGNSNRGCSGR
jgi:hypothetical protein